jgi:hypothetical protein
MRIFSTRFGVCQKLALLALFLVISTTSIWSQRKSTTTSISKQESSFDGRSLSDLNNPELEKNLKKNAETLRFIENKGQIDNRDVLFYFESKSGAVYIEKNRIRFVALDTEEVVVEEENPFFPEAEKNRTETRLKGSHTFSLYLDGGNSFNDIVLGEQFKTKYNYLIGENSSSWTRGVQAAKDLTIKNVYPGIDIRLYSTANGQLEFDWIVAKDADYKKINMRFEGQHNLSVNEKGGLEAKLAFTTVSFAIPESYQVTAKGKSMIAMAFDIQNGNRVGFVTSSIIDTNYPIIIDPVLSWGTFFDGNNTQFDQYLFAIQVDPSTGIVYCAGGTNKAISTSSAPYDANGYLNVVTGFGNNATPRLPIIYRISADGSDLIDLTLYGPSTVDDNTGSADDDNAIAYGLSLSQNRVFITGKTNVNMPMTGSPFDSSRSGWDGFVACFSKDLGTLIYSTYLGGSGDEDPGATSIRAINDNSFVVGLTAEGSLPSAYFHGGSADNSFSGNSDMYIARFNNLNTLALGTYVGGSSDEFFNDLELFPDGRIAFAGYGYGQLVELNSAAGRSTSTDNLDGIIGVLNAAGTAYLYLDEIGGTNDDYINDCELVGSTIYFTGTVGSGFPTSSGSFDTSHNGGTDAIVGKVSDVGGSSSYRATYYGGDSNEIGGGIRLVTQVDCDGNANTFLLVFGTSNTSGSGLPTLNINNEPFFDSSNNGGLDIFFAGFKGDLTGPLVYGTLIGGQYNDYLGDTGKPRGANHLWTQGANVYCGTTVHSQTITPNILGNGGFDTSKTNFSDPEFDDTHVIFVVEFAALLGSDYGDAPASYGTPGHILDCPNLYIGSLVDDEASHQASTNANNDDNNISDDEDGVTSFPLLTAGSGQNISITVNSLVNTTGNTATMYAWIDLNGDGVFQSSEVSTVSIANNHAGSVVLNWTNVTVSGNSANRYLRIRLTTDALIDNPVTTSTDERANGGASNGEVEDYRLTSMTCPTNLTVNACSTNAQVEAAYLAWLNSATHGSACSGGAIAFNPPAAPNKCGGQVTVIFNYSNSCGATMTCNSTFTVSSPPAVSLNCPAPYVGQSCMTQAQVNTAYNNWLNSVTGSGGCNGAITHNGGAAPNACAGGTNVVTFTYTSSCSPITTTCQSTFSIPTINALSFVSCPSPTDLGCNPNGIPNALTLATSGGCGNVNVSSNLGPITSNGCEKTRTRTYTATDACGQSVQCLHVFTWKEDNSNPTFTICPTGGYIGCNPMTFPTPAAPVVTDNCGTPSISSQWLTPVANGCNYSRTFQYTATDACNNSAVCNVVYTYVVDLIDPVLSGCPTNASYSCYSDVPAAANVTALDNCSGSITPVYNETQTNQGSSCNNTITRTWTATDACGNDVSCSQTITVNDIIDPVLSGCPTNANYSCYSDVPAAATVTALDNCSGSITPVYNETQTNQGSSCNNTITRTWTATDACGNDVSCTQIITVKDETDPVLTGCPSDASYSCYADVPVAATVTAFDNCSGNITPVYNETQSNQGSSCNNTITRTWTATDACGNDVSCSQTIIVNDNIDPVLTGCPQNANYSCYADVPDAATVTAFDNCSGSITPVYSETQSNPGSSCNNTITRTWTATDACENTASCTQTIIVNDNIDPVLTGCPSNESYTCYADVPAAAVVTAQDNCDGSITPVYNETQTSNGSSCNNTITRTWTATDACGNDVTCTQIIIVNDNIAPVITCPAGADLGCNPEGLPEEGVLITSDNCSEVNYNSYYEDPIANGCEYSVNLIYVAYDDCDNTTTCAQTFTYKIDTTDPVLTSVIDEVIYVNCPDVANSLEVTFEDNCDQDLTITYSNDQTIAGCSGMYERYVTAVDGCDNSITVTQTVVKIDETLPVLHNIPASIEAECGELPAVPTDVYATDNCDQSLTVEFEQTGDIFGCNANVTRTWSVTDDCGNTTTASQTIVIYDNTPPSFVDCPLTASYSCLADVPEAEELTATDNCTSPLSYDFDQDIVGDDCYATITRTWTVTDACGNTSDCIQIIDVMDFATPWIICPDDVIVSCTDEIPAVDITSVQAGDNCSEVTVTWIGDESTQTQCVNRYVITRTYEATDACGNTMQCEQTIGVYDNIGPEFLELPDADVSCGPDTEVIYPIVVDGCGQQSTVTYEDVPYNGSTNEDCGEFTTFSKGGWGAPNGTAANYRDANFAAAFPAGLTIGCATGSLVLTTAQAVEDLLPSGGGSANLPAGILVNPTDATFSNNFADQLIAAKLNVGFDMYDANFGGSANNLADLIFLSGPFAGETVADVIIIADNEIGGCTNSYDNSVLLGVMESINLSYHEGASSSETLGCNPEFNNICGEPFIRNWSATDACGNVTVVPQLMFYVDDQEPVIYNCPEDASYDCYANVPAPAIVTAEDNCSGILDVTFTQTETNQGSSCNNQITRIWMAEDNCGNRTFCEQIIMVNDNIDPIVTSSPEAEIWVECFEDVPVFTVEFSDNCDSDLHYEAISGIGINGCEQLISRSMSATDDCGNSVSYGQLVHILDTTNPEILSSPLDFVIGCLDEVPAVDEVPTFSDNCDDELSVEFDESEEVLPCGTRIIRTWTASDDCGNSVVATQWITRLDTTTPWIEVLAPYVSFECEIPANWVGIVAGDDCGEVEIEWTDNAVSGECYNGILRDYVVTDACGNIATAQVIIDIIDITPPVITAPDSYTVQCYDAPTGAPMISVFDNCDNSPEIISATEEILVVNACTYQVVYQWIAEDDCGNQSVATTIVTVTDTESPWLENIPSSATYNCGDVWTVIPPTVHDECNAAQLISDDYILPGNCENTYTIVYTYYAIDACGNMSSTVEVMINVVDNEVPEFTSNPQDQHFDCLNINNYIPQVVTVTDNCFGAVDLDVEIEPLTTGSCGSALYEVIYTATDLCGNAANISYVVTVSDETAPVLSGCPQNVSIPCSGQVPAPPVVTAYDACQGVITPQLQESYTGDVPTPGSIADCNILTPVRPVNNPCKYPVDWAMALFNLPQTHRFYKVTNGNFVQFPNGTIQVTATFYNAYNSNNGWNATMTFVNGMAWAQWSSQTFPTNFKADCGGVGANHSQWMYYRLLNTPGVELVGFGAYAGSSLNIKHAPTNNYFGFQLGNGANNYNNSYGFGGWFSYQGQFYINGNPYNTTGNIAGGGDFAFTLDCCPNYQIHRTWVATDCAGNTSTCTQTVTIGTPPVNAAIVDEVFTDVNATAQQIRIQPNPTNGETWFYFIAQNDGVATLELYDMTGKKIKDLYLNSVESQQEYGVSYDAAQLATGIYMYRLNNGNYQEVGKLIVNK